MAVAYREPLFETVGKRMVVTGCALMLIIGGVPALATVRFLLSAGPTLAYINVDVVPGVIIAVGEQLLSDNLDCQNKEIGPDYIKDHLPKVHQHTAYIGEKRPALEKTGDLRYLCRSASSRSLPAKYKHEYTGGIGWGIPEYNFINRSRMESGFQIKYGEISHCAIDKLTHRYQNPWQPKPFVLDKQGGYSRGFLAWNMSDYEDTHERNSKRAILIKQSKLLRTTLPSRLPKLLRKEEKVSCHLSESSLEKSHCRLERGICFNSFTAPFYLSNQTVIQVKFPL
ncbi:uncharacterized protein C4orf45 homolog [Acomys russatus]|uniref:uncharacterized protein C4orf45 homolog n=1 Tax=Acomys russatus TaxID=60746 RepID=UPI0021E28A5E|nr:uncharacterized protein C4orf45 homolog [Acomys russatus]